MVRANADVINRAMGGDTHWAGCRGPARLSCRVTRSKSSRFTKNHRRDRPVHDLAHGEARLNPRHPRQSREFGSVNAFEVLDIARQDNDDVVVASRHQEASNHRWTVDDRGFERFQRLLVLTFQGDPDQNGGGETEARQIQNGLIASDETFFLQHLLPSGDRRAREPDPLGEFDLAGAGIDREERIAASMLSSFIGFVSCANSPDHASFRQDFGFMHQDRKDSNLYLA